MGDGHINDDDLDLYAMGRIYAIDRRMIEDHLVLCLACQRRLTAIETLIRALREHRIERGQ